MVEWFISRSLSVWRDSVGKLSVSFIHPVLRAQHSPEYTARGVGVGVFVALTPFFGAHIAIVFMLWIVAKIVNKNLSFSPVLASAWTLLSNVFTIAPLFYIFILTGWFILGRWDDFQTFETYRPALEPATYGDPGWLEVMTSLVVGLFAKFGIPLFIGCLPWAIGLSILGYFLSLHFIRKHRAAGDRV